MQGDNLLLIGDPEKAAELAAEYHLQPKQVSDDRRKRKLLFQAVGMVEVMLPPGSSLIGHSLKKLHFQSIFNCLVLAIRRKGEPITSAFEELPLQFGDVLLVSADWKNIIKLADYRDRFLLLDGTAFFLPAAIATGIYRQAGSTATCADDNNTDAPTEKLPAPPVGRTRGSDGKTVCGAAAALHPFALRRENKNPQPLGSGREG